MDSYCYMQSLDDAEEREVKRLELIDRINRVPQPPIEAASRGTALNAIVDYLSNGVAIQEGMTFREDGDTYVAELDGFTFVYDRLLVETLSNEVQGCLCQVFGKADIKVAQGTVTLYGYADYVNGCDIIDLKSTSSYDVGKFRDHWQHLVYPYCFVKSGDIEDFDTFHYLVAEIKKGRDGIIRAMLYKESYNPSMEEIEKCIKQFLQHEFIPFLEDNRHLISSTKIFS